MGRLQMFENGKDTPNREKWVSWTPCFVRTIIGSWRSGQSRWFFVESRLMPERIPGRVGGVPIKWQGSVAEDHLKPGTQTTGSINQNQLGKKTFSVWIYRFQILTRLIQSIEPIRNSWGINCLSICIYEWHSYSTYINHFKWDKKTIKFKQYIIDDHLFLFKM